MDRKRVVAHEQFWRPLLVLIAAILVVSCGGRSAAPAVSATATVLAVTKVEAEATVEAARATIAAADAAATAGAQSAAGAPAAPPAPVLHADTPTTAPSPMPGPPTATATSIPLVTLTGRVIEATTGMPLAGATVHTGERGTVTDAAGRFSFVGLASGQLNLLIEHEGFEPYLSGMLTLAPGAAQELQARLDAVSAGAVPRDPMATNQLDPRGAATADDALRLARAQGFTGPVASISETTLSGKYLVNYSMNGTVRAAVATLNHPAWELVDQGGKSWYIIKVCGNLARPVPGGFSPPVQLLCQPSPAITPREGAVKGYACPSETCDVVATLSPGWPGLALRCTGGCEWVQVRGPGVNGECWVRAKGLRPTESFARLPIVSCGPADGLIAYVKLDSIWLIAADGSGAPRKLVDKGEGRYADPGWSPDGKALVAIYSTEYPNEATNLHMIEFATGAARPLTPYVPRVSPAALSLPAWSPDGKTILYAHTYDGLRRVWRVVTVGVDGSNPAAELPIQQGYRAWGASWAPDGNRIAYALMVESRLKVPDNVPPENWGIWVAGLDGSNPKEIAIGDSISTRWSPDGSLIAYTLYSGKGYDIAVAGKDGGGRQITQDHGSLLPDWSPDGAQIAYVRQDLQTHAATIWIMNADGSGAHYLTDGQSPAWQPGGGSVIQCGPGNAAATPTPTSAPGTGLTSKLAFFSDRDSPGRAELYVMNTDGSDQARLTSDLRLAPALVGAGPTLNSVTFCDARQSIVFQNPAGGEVIEVKEDGTHRLVASAVAYVAPAPDGKQLAYETYTGGRNEIGLMGFDGGGRRLVTGPATRSELGLLADSTLVPGGWSSTGDRLAFYTSEDAICTVDGTGGSAVCLGWSPVPVASGQLRWSPDDRTITISTLGQRDGNLYNMDVATGRFSPFVEGARTSDWSPDGKRVVFEDVAKQIWIADADGTGRVQLTSAGKNCCPVWIP